MNSRISLTSFPKQSDWVRKCVKTSFKDASWCYGILVRDDLEEPFHTLIQLFDGRVITAEEAWWEPAYDEEAERKITGIVTKLKIRPAHPPLDAPSPTADIDPREN